jgi:hypothetical protein
MKTMKIMIMKRIIDLIQNAETNENGEAKNNENNEA